MRIPKLNEDEQAQHKKYLQTISELYETQRDGWEDMTREIEQKIVNLFNIHSGEEVYTLV